MTRHITITLLTAAAIAGGFFMAALATLTTDPVLDW